MRMARMPAKVQNTAKVCRTARRLATDKQDTGCETHIEEGQVTVAKGRDGIAQQSDGQKGQPDLVCLGAPDLLALGVGKDIDAGNIKQGGSELHSKSDGDVADDIAPAANVGAEPANLCGRKHKGLVVDTSGGGIHACDFSQRSGDTENDQGDNDPAPNDNGRAAALERIVERRSETVGDRGEHKGHEGDMPSGTSAHQLGLVAHGLEEPIGIVRVVAGRRPYLGGGHNGGGAGGGLWAHWRVVFGVLAGPGRDGFGGRTAKQTTAGARRRILQTAGET